MQVVENKEKKLIAPHCISTELHVVFQRGQRGGVALHTAAQREETHSPGTDRDVSGSGETGWRQHTHYRGSHGGKSWMTNPCVLLSSTKKPCACPATPPLLLDVTTAFNLITLLWLKRSKKTEVSVAVITKSYLDLLQSPLTPCDSAVRPLNHPWPTQQMSMGR